MTRSLWLAALLAAAPASAQLQLSPVFGSHMVLQRETEAPFFGRTTPGAAIEVRPSWSGGKVFTGRAGADGRFSVRVATPEASGPHTVVIAAGNFVQRLEDVLIGEVWVCSGQSNMDWSIRESANPEQEKAGADHPRIRLLQVADQASAGPQESCRAEWQVCTPDTAYNFSAIGYSYARALQRELGVPVGVISSDWGGTPAEAWTTAEALAEFDEFREEVEELQAMGRDAEAAEARYARAVDAWKDEVAAMDPGFAGSDHPVGWAVPRLDDETWEEVVLPAKWSETGLGSFDGTVWYRKDVEIPANWAGRDLILELGPIDDDEQTWFAGASVGATDGWNVARRYRIPGRLVRPGATNVTVRAHDTNGEGGFGGKPEDMRLRVADMDGASIGLAGGWKFRRGLDQKEVPARPRAPRPHSHAPSALYNGMIAPLVPFAVRGAIWYQGESNVGRAAQYERLFPAMITSWRDAWGQGDFPFYFVQIAPYQYKKGEGPAEIRDAQRKTLTAVPNVGMAVTMDVGNPRDIHPKNKVAVAERLARWALHQTYGKADVVPSGPLVREAKAEGSKLRVTFDHATGLSTRDGKAPSHFEVAGEDGVFHPATAAVDDEAVLVESAAVAAPAWVRYGWGEADEPNLQNAEGLPASSFRVQKS
ncbi:MAG: 9-O-acetylesterase [Planctomycetota bacterium]|nr:9-O-acetylesterase [Planctomycetota bacterium]